MKEAGEIIEMIDLEQIQDLHFKTYQFENNPNGKMLLGILFATSKQYSDKLSVDVSSSITGAIRDGKPMFIGCIHNTSYGLSPIIGSALTGIDYGIFTRILAIKPSN